MDGIPPARESDNEDVIWALDTAESLWKRNARVDAIVWVKRAAQEAAEAGDETRAAELVAEAASLTEALGRTSAQLRAAARASVAPPADAADAGGAEDIDDLLASGDHAVLADGRVDGAARALDGYGGGDLDAIESLDDDDLLLDPTPTGPPPAPVLTARPPEGAPDSHAPVQVSFADLLPSSEAPTPVVNEGASLSAEPEVELPGITPLGADSLSPMDLAGVAALAGCSEAQRSELVRHSRVILCASGAELPHFALALVLEGEVIATSEQDGETVARVRAGGLVRTRGTLDVATSARFSSAVDDTTVAVWTDARLAACLADAPAVDQRLRSEGDRLQAWTAVTTSALSSRLYQDVRLRLVDRLEARALRPGAELVGAGASVPGLFLVGVGSVTLDAPLNAMIRSGEFVFPDATLSAGKATATARAGNEGAVVLCADRRTTQELWATEPLLLELLSS
jgi:hypothetical protein